MPKTPQVAPLAGMTPMGFAERDVPAKLDRCKWPDCETDPESGLEDSGYCFGHAEEMATMLAETLVTPGKAASSSSTRSNRARLRSGSYPFNRGERPKATTLSVDNPRSTRLTFARLLMNRPAATNRAMDRLICAVTRIERNRAAARAPDG